MRDLRKLRTKYEIKLDNRHIAYLLAGELLVVAIMFSLGVVVGKGMGQLEMASQNAAPAALPTPAPVDLAAGNNAAVGIDALLHNDADLNPPAPTPAAIAPTPAELPPPTMTPPPTAADLAPAIDPTKAQVPIGSLPAPPKGGDYWTVQIGSYPTREEAMAMYNRMVSSGNVSAVEEADLGERGTWYRVSIGQYATEAGARAMAAAMRQREGLDTWVRYVP